MKKRRRNRRYEKGRERGNKIGRERKGGKEGKEEEEVRKITYTRNDS